jgi:hypothetical protein
MKRYSRLTYPGNPAASAAIEEIRPETDFNTTYGVKLEKKRKILYQFLALYILF